MEPPPQATPSPAVRVLSRAPPPKSSSSPSSHDGVVAVGFVGAAGSARIADRILDAHVFSPGGSARGLAGGVRYHRDGDGRMVFLHLTPLDDAEGDPGPAELPHMLFMFSVSPPGFLLCLFLIAIRFYMLYVLVYLDGHSLSFSPVHKTRLLYCLMYLLSSAQKKNLHNMTPGCWFGSDFIVCHCFLLLRCIVEK
jgi:hypothetical protein